MKTNDSNDETETASRTWESYDGDPTLHMGPCMNGPDRPHVHWRGYLTDMGPTEDARALGEAVVVYGGRGPYASEHWLRPTGYGLPPKWDARFVVYSNGTRRLRGGAKGSRFISDGHGMWRVPEKVYSAAGKSGFTTLDPKTTFEFMATAPGVPVLMSSAIHDGEFVGLGRAWVSEKLFDSLRDLQVETVLVAGPLDAVVAEGVAVIMPVRREHEPREAAQP